MNTIINQYFIDAVSFMYENIDQPILIAEIADHVGISVAHLKRVFLEMTEKSIGTFMRRMRMELAFRSLQEKKQSILEVALDAGFEDHAAFSRCFKKTFGYPPSIARKKERLVDELESIELDEPIYVQLSDIVVKKKSATGTYFKAAPEAWELLRSALSSEIESDDFTGIFIGIGHDNPHEGKAAYDQVRFSAGVVCDQIVDQNLELFTLKGGKYAQFLFKGKLNNLGLAYHYIFGAWEQKAGITIDHSREAFQTFYRFPDSIEEEILLNIPLL